MTKIEEIVLTLSNDGQFYKEWETAKKSSRWVDSDFRNLIRRWAHKLLHINPSIGERETIRQELEKHWSNEVQQPQVTASVAAPEIKKEEEVMTQKGIAVQSVQIKTVTYMNGVPIHELSKEQLIDAIAQCEADLERMSKLNTKSKAITAKREAIQATIDKIVALLDGE